MSVVQFWALALTFVVDLATWPYTPFLALLYSSPTLEGNIVEPGLTATLPTLCCIQLFGGYLELILSLSLYIYAGWFILNRQNIDYLTLNVVCCWCAVSTLFSNLADCVSVNLPGVRSILFLSLQPWRESRVRVTWLANSSPPFMHSLCRWWRRSVISYSYLGMR